MEFAARTRVMTPLCYHAAFDEVTLDSLILLEDLGNEDMGAGDETFSFDEGVISLTTLARMHAAFWNAEELTSLAWLFREDVPALPLLQLVEARYPTFLERFGKRVPVALAPTLGRLAAGSVPTFRSPLTLCHGDFHRNNVCIRGDGTPIFFDWQLVSRGPAALDVQRFFMAALRAPGGIEQIAALQDVYCRALRDAGVSGYPREMLERDCRAAAVLRLSRAVGIGGDPAALDENRNATVERILSETGVLLAGTEPEALFA
jgi:hypothetical protein